MKNLNPLIAWYQTVVEMLSDQGTITIPTDFHERSALIAQHLENDTSGLINTILDLYISSALVDFKIETDNKNLTKELNDWLANINSSLRGKKIDVGIKGLAKQYFYQRWKGSSLLALRTLWITKDGWNLPEALWFANGGSIYIDSKEDSGIIGKENYFLKVDNKTNNKVPIPSKKNEELFVQSPYAPWGVDYPSPFIVQRGILKNLKFMERVSSKAEKIISKALEYMLLFKKGDAQLALANKASYSPEDLKKLQENFKEFKDKTNTTSGSNSMFTNFDTTIEHLIPDYEKALKGSLLAPIERRILEGLGLVEIVEGVGTTRKEAVFNPKAMELEIRQGIKDFKTLILDVVETIKLKNPKRYNLAKIKIVNTPVTEFLSKDALEQFRRMFTYGILSKETYTLVCGDNYIDYDLEVKRRMDETSKGHDETMYPPIIQALEKQEPLGDDETPEDKKGADKQDFVASAFGIEAEELAQVFEEAPYNKIEDFPKHVKDVLTKTLQKSFLKVFNDAFERYGTPQESAEIAWSIIKKTAKQNKSGKWTKKTKAELKKSTVVKTVNELSSLVDLEIKEKKSKLLSRLLKDEGDKS